MREDERPQQAWKPRRTREDWRSGRSGSRREDPNDDAYSAGRREDDYRERDYRERDYRDHDYREHDDREQDDRVRHAQDYGDQDDDREWDDRSHDYREQHDRERDYRDHGYRQQSARERDYRDDDDRERDYREQERRDRAPASADWRRDQRAARPPTPREHARKGFATDDEPERPEMRTPSTRRPHEPRQPAPEGRAPARGGREPRRAGPDIPARRDLSDSDDARARWERQRTLPRLDRVDGWEGASDRRRPATGWPQTLGETIGRLRRVRLAPRNGARLDVFTDAEFDMSDDLSARHDERDERDETERASGPVALTTKRRSRVSRLFATRRARIISITVLVALLLGSLGSVTALISLAGQYRQIQAQTHDALQHLKNAEEDLKRLGQNPLDGAASLAAQNELRTSNADFARIQRNLDAYPSALEYLPFAGAKLGAAKRLVPLAVEGTQAGVIACQMAGLVASRLKDPLNSSSQGLTAQDMSALQGNMGQITAIFNHIVTQIKQLQPSDAQLDPRLGPLLATLTSNLPAIQQAVQDAQTFFSLAPDLLGVGKPTNYLLLVLDSTEIRPGGGFIGNDGTLALNGGRLGDIHIEDVDILDKSFRTGPKVIPIPSTYSWFHLVDRWGLRDTNLDADFPTSARYAESLYKQEGGTVATQGAIAITPWVIQKALKITGPVFLSEYNETITPDNLVDRIHYYQLTDGVPPGPSGVRDPLSDSSLRKRFTGLLFQAFLAKVKSGGPTELPQLARLLIDSIHSKDIQIYLDAEAGENILRRYHLASAIDAPSVGDSLMTVDANIGASKSNYFIKLRRVDQVTIDAAGNAVHHDTLTYDWPKTQESVAYNFGNPTGVPVYTDYVRLYAPPGSTLTKQQGWGASPPAQAFGRAAFGGLLSMLIGSTATISLDWTVPHAAYKDAQGWHYSLLTQRQAGIFWTDETNVTLPSCAKIKGAPKGLSATGAQSASFTTQLTQDQTVSIDYVC